jgi:hypothetical protein
MYYWNYNKDNRRVIGWVRKQEQARDRYIRHLIETSITLGVDVGIQQALNIHWTEIPVDFWKPETLYWK